jgi:hypothetical protein
LLLNWTDLISIADAVHAEDIRWRGWIDPYLAAVLRADGISICYTNDVRENRRLGRFFQGISLSTLARMLKATDLRDKAYGLLGLVPMQVQADINVDVGKSIVAVYTDFSRSLLKYENDLGLLECAGLSNSAIADLPSWCIDFSQSRKQCSVILTTQFQAGRSKNLLPCNEYLDAGSSGPLLTILGWKVDCINEVVKDMPYWDLNDWDMESAEAADKLEEACLQISRTIFNSPDDIPDEHWRTITCDRGRDEKGSRREEYLEWKQLIQAMAKFGEPFPGKQGDQSLLSLPRNLCGHWNVFNEDVNGTCYENTFYSTERGRIGIGPPEAEPGDFVCIPYQSDIPYIMRRNDENGRYKLLGQTYCSGVMYGEIFDMGDELKAMEVRFVID